MTLVTTGTTCRADEKICNLFSLFLNFLLFGNLTFYERELKIWWITWHVFEDLEDLFETERRDHLNKICDQM